ncbi:MAG: hypothetical protein P8P74_04890 [Crocinitomicaceae bacterium]|nr:hypothetical protein [Crocinitomicaceae bacterium]
MRTLTFLVYIGCSQFASSQYMEFEWSNEFRYTNRKTGFFTEFVGTNTSLVYLLQRNVEKSKPYDDAKLMLVSMTKNTLNMTEEERLPLKGYPENKGQESALASLDYVKTVLSEGKIFVFWRKLINTDTTRTEEIYAQSFKSDFKTDLPLKKVFEYTQEVEDRASVYDPTMCVVLSDQESGLMVLGTETYADSTLKFQYVTVSSQLSASTRKSVLLPQKPVSYPGRITSEYQLSENGPLQIRSTVAYTVEELYYLEAKHAKTYPVLTVASVESGTQKSVKFTTNFRTITDFNLYSAGGKTRVFGFFGDLVEDTTGIDNQGLFYADIDINNTEETKVNFVYFTRSIYNRIFPKKRMRVKRGQVLPSQEEVLGTRFDIQHITSMSDSSLVFFFTEQYNYKETETKSNLNGENVYHTEESCKNKNVSAIRLSAAGEIMWARSVDRKISYLGNNVSDIRVVYKYGDFIVLFGNEDAELSPPKKKKLKHLTEELTYYTFDENSGRAKEFTTPVNEPKTEKRDLKYLDPNSSIVMDDQFYFYKMRVRQNPLWTAANVVCFPTLYYTFLTGNTKVGKADFTVMRVMEGKRPRRKR